jgi:hypothetical protein
LLNTWNRVNEFALPSGECEELPDKIQKIPQPVLTRWWYVGIAAAFLKKYFQIVLRATQICININDSKSCPNKIASGLQSMMKEDIAYSDVLFWAQFHTDFLMQRFRWLQEEDKIAKNPGFRCWQILVRSYLMRKDLVVLKTWINWNSFGDYDSFGDHGKKLEKLSDDKKEMQKRKSETFIEVAMTSLDNHYLQWCNKLLPAALGGEAPLA